ncbi:GlxA family transcriptional regulator [Gymnodinialimonas sp. 57CJ19]|uniref:GlxA family transcriptional regulator n=1 Tax=Gymnodinialimonas sp. 57CJ19 TaxID=3138498 RepID=UPI0031342BCB
MWADRAVIPDGAFTSTIKEPRPTKWFGFLLLPEFTLLAFSSALDPLRIANQLAQHPLYGWHVVSEDGMPASSSSGLPVGVHGKLEEISDDLPLFICSGNNWSDAASTKTLGTVRRRARFGAVHGGICTGAATLARAGLLKGKQFTLHWENQPGFIEQFPDLAPTGSRFEEDGDLLTCGGGAAAAEMMLVQIARDYGRDFAVVVADMCLNDPDLSGSRPQRSSIATAVATRNPKLVGVVQQMYHSIEEPLLMEELAEQAGLSRRQLERHFRKYLGETPAKTYMNIRLERARSLLVETDHSINEVAAATGFSSAQIFSRQFRDRYGQTPYGTRKGRKTREG